MELLKLRFGEASLHNCEVRQCHHAWAACAVRLNARHTRPTAAPTRMRSCASPGCSEAPPLPHLPRDWARPCHICPARPCHICTRTGLTSATSAPGPARPAGHPRPRRADAAGQTNRRSRSSPDGSLSLARTLLGARRGAAAVGPGDAPRHRRLEARQRQRARRHAQAEGPGGAAHLARCDDRLRTLLADAAGRSLVRSAAIATCNAKRKRDATCSVEHATRNIGR